MATFLALLAILLAAGIYVERERAGPERRDPRRRVGATREKPEDTPHSGSPRLRSSPSRPATANGGFCWQNLAPCSPAGWLRLARPGPRLQEVRGDAQWLAARPSTAPGRCGADRVVNGGSTLLTTAHVAPDMPPQRFAPVGERRSKLEAIRADDDPHGRVRLPMVYAKTARLAGYRPLLGH
jgi:hypothetical protein